MNAMNLSHLTLEHETEGVFRLCGVHHVTDMLSLPSLSLAQLVMELKNSTMGAPG